MEAWTGDLVGRTWWVGGSPCAGKTTTAARLAGELGAHLYSCDAAFERHAGAATQTSGPTLVKVTSWSAQRRLAQPVKVQVADVLALCHEQWPSVLADVEAVPGPVVVEGAALLPDLVAALGVPAGRAVWMVAAEAFQREHYAQRVWALELARSTRDPGGSFERWMQRDARFAREVAQWARDLGYPVQVTDGSASLGASYAALRGHLDVERR